MDGNETNDPLCGGGGRAGRCECSCEAELWYLNGKVWKLEDLVCLLVADPGLVGWEETRRVKNLKRKIGLGREVVERDHVRRVAAERAAGEERKRLAKWDEQVKKAEEVQKSQVEPARLHGEQVAAAKAALAVSIRDCVKATTLEELVPRAAKVLEAAAGVEGVEAVPSPAGEDVEVGGGWRVVGGNVVREVEVVSRLGGPVGRVRTAGLSKVVGRVLTTVRSGSMSWGVSAKVWSQHGSNEILWTVSGVAKVVGDAEMMQCLRVGVEAVVGPGEVVCWWVEDHLSKYVVVRGIP